MHDLSSSRYLRHILFVTSALVAPFIGLGCGDAHPELEESRELVQALQDNDETTCVQRGFSSFSGASWSTRAEYRGDTLIWWMYTRCQGMDGSGEQRDCQVIASTDMPPPEMPVKEVVSYLELHDLCEDDILSKSEEDWEITLEFDDRGYLESCFAVLKGCVDDCSEGIGLNSFDVGMCSR